MIKNERQYRITKAQLDRFRQGIDEMARNRDTLAGVHPDIAKAQLEAMQSQYNDLRVELDEYEALQAGKHKVLDLQSFADLPSALVRARIAAGLSHNDLGKLIGIKEQQIQRYEDTGYAGASFERLQQVMDALGVHVSDEIYLPAADLTPKALLDRLRSVGIDSGFALRRLLPSTFTSEGSRKDRSIAHALDAANILARIFGWTTKALFGDEPLRLAPAAAETARFKVKKGQDVRELYAYAAYAHYLARLAAKTCTTPVPLTLPSDADMVRAAVANESGALALGRIVEWLWAVGIPVLPLEDPGSFHSACWRLDERPVIVIKQRTLSEARWIHDLLHEYWHLASEIGDDEFAHVDWEDAFGGHDHLTKEAAANIFAGDVELDGRAEELAEKCVAAAHGSVEQLKSCVPVVAKKEGVRADSLANYLAFRLSLQGINWWGAAANLQPQQQQPFAVVRDVFFRKAHLPALDGVERGIISRALAPAEEP